MIVTNMMPTAQRPRSGTFVASQIEGIRAAGVDVDVLHLDRSEGGMGVYRHIPGLFKQSLMLIRPDVVHVMYGGVMAYLVTRKRSRPPCAVSFCGTDVLGEESGPILWRLRGAVGVWCSRRAAMRAEHVIVKSRGLCDALPAGIARDRVSLIPNGVDLGLFRPMNSARCRERLGWAENVFHVVFSYGEMGGTNKRLALAEHAVAIMNAKGMPVSLHVMTQTPHREVPVWLNAAGAVLLTSLHEGSPNIVKEALACNCPVVSVDVGDVRERIGPIDGCFITADTPEALACGLGEVAARPGRIDGRSSMSDLSLGSVAERIVGVYRSLVQARVREGPPASE